MLKVGLTGSIAVGKSFVLSSLGDLGARTIDADAVAREVVEPGTVGLNSVVEVFGSEVLRPDGSLDRPKLGSIVFADEAKRQKLNLILHPLILARQDEIMRHLANESPNAIVVVDAALMIESGGYKRFDKLIVVHCDSEVQLERLMKRDGISRAEAERRIKTQMPQEKKKRHADYLIDTSSGFESTRQQTIAVWQQLRALSGSLADTDNE